MESKENKDLDGFVKRKIDEIPVDYKEANWDKAFLILETALPVLPKTNWFWWLGGADFLLLAGSAAWVAGGLNNPQLAHTTKQKTIGNMVYPREIQVNTILTDQGSSNHSNVEIPQTSKQGNYYAFNTKPEQDIINAAPGISAISSGSSSIQGLKKNENTSGKFTSSIRNSENTDLEIEQENISYKQPEEHLSPALSQTQNNSTDGSNLYKDSGAGELPSTELNNPSKLQPAEQNEQNLLSQKQNSPEVQKELLSSASGDASPPPPDLKHADSRLNSFFSISAGAGASPSLTQSWKATGASYSLALQFNRSVKEQIDFFGSAGINYRNSIQESATIEQLSYGFGSTVVQSKVNWLDMLSAELRGGIALNYHQKHHICFSAGTQFLVDTRAEVISSNSEKSQGKWGYREGFRKADLLIGARYEFQFCPKWRAFTQFTQGLGDMMDDHYFGRNGKQRNVSLLFGVHFLMRSGTSGKTTSYVKP